MVDDLRHAFSQQYLKMQMRCTRISGTADPGYNLAASHTVADFDLQ
jgi:hypothetical protein